VRKGQAAMEFLMTYGWAILAAIIAIGVLAYFGVFSPGKFVPTATVLNAPLYANAWNVVTEAGVTTLSVEVKNNGGDDITLTAFTVSNVDYGGLTSGYTAACDGATTATGTVAPGGTATVDIICDEDDGTGGIAFTAGETVKADIAVSYEKTTGGLDLTSTGTFASTVA